jgi:hypothetical protein
MQLMSLFAWLEPRLGYRRSALLLLTHLTLLCSYFFTT